MKTIWHNFFISPLSSALFFLADMTGNLGIAIIILTIGIQLLLWPLRLPSLRSAEKMKLLKPHLDDLKKKHKDNPQKMMQEQMDLYREHGVNPFGGIFALLLSFPIVIALYQVFQTAVSSQTQGVEFLWMNLAQPDGYYILPIIVGGTQWFLTRMSMPTPSSPTSAEPDMATTMQKHMQIIFPLMLGFITLQLPSGVGIYFVVSAVFAIIQQVIIQKKLWIHKQ